MAITFYYGSGSPFAWKVWLTLEHKGLAYEFRRIQFNQAELKSPEFLAISPRGKVPALVDDGLAIHESAAIVEYLEDRYPTPTVLGATAAERARTRALAAEADCYAYPTQRELFVQTLFRPVEQGRDLEAIGRAHEAALTELARWERHLGEQPFLGGATPNLADYAAFPVLRGLRRVDDREPAHGLGDRWPAWALAYLARMEALPSVEKSWPPHWKG
ncbi:MAG: glutathione S-transferase family protein [Polyangiaceae bacterium]|jgi:glutathione S-transferase|nr:glutathione S-transferase family protein [Polyangiaceae bacterium]